MPRPEEVSDRPNVPLTYPYRNLDVPLGVTIPKGYMIVGVENREILQAPTPLGRRAESIEGYDRFRQEKAVSLMPSPTTPEEALRTSTYLQKLHEGKTEAQAQEEAMKVYQEEVWVKGTVAGKTMRGWQYIEKQSGLPVSFLGQFASGAAGVFESWVPVFVPSYPRPPATPSSALISTAFGTEQQGYFTPSSEWKYLGEHPAYLVGGLTGTYLEAVGLGYAAGKAFEGLKRIVPEAIQQPLYRAKEAVRFSTPAKVLHEAKLWFMEKVPVYKIYEPFKKEIARGEIALPSIERYGLKELEAESIAWKILQSPRMGGVWIARMGGEIGKASSWQYLMKGSAGWIVKEATFTPLVSQSQVTRMGLQPYIPKIVSENITEKTLAQLVGIGLTTVPSVARPQRLTWYPTLTRKREELRPQTLLNYVSKENQRKALPMIAIPSTEQLLKQTPALIQKVLPKTVQRTALYFPTPTPTIPKTSTPFSPFRLPGSGQSGGGETKSFFGRWFRKQQQIKTPKQMIATFFGAKGRKRKR